ncbi:hypothetical protein ACS0TY_010885 [Phlomoides rotata]
MRVFKWTPNFDISHEVPIAPVWVRFLGLPIHLIHTDALFIISNEFGKPLQVDHQTTEHSRLTYARVCIEMDLLQEPIPEFEIDICGVSYTQRMVYENRVHGLSACRSRIGRVMLRGISLVPSGVIGLLGVMLV